MWQDIIKTVAPVLGTALGGPFGGMAAKVITGKLLGDDNATDEISIAQEAIAKASPADLLLLKQEDNNFKLEMEKLGVDVYKIDQADRVSAREREKQVGSVAVNLLAALVVGGFCATVYAVFSLVTDNTIELDTFGAGLIGTVVGYMSAKADQVVAYFFGSSHGSKAKTDAMANAMRTVK